MSVYWVDYQTFAQFIQRIYIAPLQDTHSGVPHPSVTTTEKNT